MPAHDGLWESAAATAHSLPARLAVEACVHEARGLDVLPQTIARCAGNMLTGCLSVPVVCQTHCHVLAALTPKAAYQGRHLRQLPSGGSSLLYAVLLWHLSVCPRNALAAGVDSVSSRGNKGCDRLQA